MREWKKKDERNLVRYLLKNDKKYLEQLERQWSIEDRCLRNMKYFEGK